MADEQPKPKNVRKPHVGADVHFWPPHATEPVSPADAPFAGKIAKVNEDGTANLSLLNNAGIWTGRLSVKFSEAPAVFCWTWPVK